MLFSVKCVFFQKNRKKYQKSLDFFLFYTYSDDCVILFFRMFIHNMQCPVIAGRLLPTEKPFARATIERRCGRHSSKDCAAFRVFSDIIITAKGDAVMSNTVISLKNIAVSFDGEKVLENLNLDIHDGEFVTFLGPSGCGKTTTLRIIGGFVEPDSGDIFFNGTRINGVPAHKRAVNTVFQRYALFPHLNVFENVAFGMRLKKKSQAEIEEKVAQMLRLVDLTGFEKRRVNNLSGGQQQRVTIARALANDPKVLLLDEPLGALDLKLRKDMQIELKKIQKSLGITFIYVTHDQEEALSMSDTIVVMNHGVIQQIGSPTDIYNEPINGFVADFIGESNIVDGVYGDDYKVTFCDAEFDCVDLDFAKNEEVDVVIRPEDVIVTPKDEGKFTGTVISSTFKGVHYEMMVKVPNQEEDWIIHSTVEQKADSEIGMTVEPENIHIMKKYTGDYASDIDFVEVEE